MTSVYQPNQQDKQIEIKEDISDNPTNSISAKSSISPEEIKQFNSVFTALERELDRAGKLEKPEIRDKLLQLEKFSAKVKKLAEVVDKNLTQRQLKTMRQQASAIATAMHQAADLDTLLKTTVNEIQTEIGCSRVCIYRFHTFESGIVLAESQTRGWTPTLGEKIPAICFGLGDSKEYLAQQIVEDDINDGQLTPYQLQLWQKFQVKSSLSLAILLKGQVWGLLVLHECTSPRGWQELEISLLYQVLTQLSQCLQAFEFNQLLEMQLQQQKSVSKVIDKIRQASDVEEIFKTTTQEVRQLLRCDRVAVYRFYPDWSGEFVTESVGAGWRELVGPEIKTIWPDTYLQDTQGGRYRYHEAFAVDDIYQAGHSACHIDILEQFEIKAYLVVPVFSGKKLWGLLAAYQNSGSRQWQAQEISFVTQIGVQFGVALAQAGYLSEVQEKSDHLAQITVQEKALAKVIDRIRASLDLATLFKTTTSEVRHLLQCDRVAVYRFHPDWSGEFVTESVASAWGQFVAPGIKTVWEDTHLQDTQGGRYAKGETFAVNDIYQAGHATCHLEILEQFNIKAYLIAPVFSGDKLWGLLAAYQHSSPRHWQAWENSLLAQIGVQFSVALSQAEYVEQIQSQSQVLARTADRQRNFINLTRKIGEALLEKSANSQQSTTILNTTAKEVRHLLQADRVVVYRFNPDWSGQYVAESVTHNWTAVMEKQHENPALLANVSDCSIQSQSKLKKVIDTYLQDSQGGNFQQQECRVINDIYSAGFSTCYIDYLEQLQARAYIIVPIFKEQKLWGLLAAFQNSQPRQWDEFEVNLMVQIAALVGVVVQQADYLTQLQLKSEQLTASLAREKTAKELLQQRAMQLLAAVRPALDGDLTVRAPITEDELGTIADAYNNTLQSLRKLVTQLVNTAQQVAETSSSSDTSLQGLSNMAQQQSLEISQALAKIQHMTNSTQAVVTNTELVQAAVQQANQTVESGDAAMNLTVESIQVIRETVAQTSKQIKRLGESSQKISKVVNLINSFATQTNVLALNAAIEATRAGEYGRGFAVVADEVRSLSRQSAAATTEIEKLVQEIQVETGEVALAMETGIQQVVTGTNLVNKTRQNLNEIVAATAQISQLLEGITQATQVQMQDSVSVTSAINDVAQIANQTANESQELAAAFKDLLGMAQKLLTSASKFKVN